MTNATKIRSGGSGRTVWNWSVRGVLLVCALALASWSLASAFAQIAKVDPARAHSAMPANGVVTAALANDEFLTRPDVSSTSPAAELARQALRQDATAVDALTVLGFQAQLRDEQALAARIFEQSSRLSRRSLRSQIWGIEQAVERGDIDLALSYYDMALRTSNEAETLLFPVLAKAIEESRIRSSLLKILARKPSWTEAFVDFAASRGSDPNATARLFEEGAKTGLVVPQPATARLVSGLAAVGDFDTAWKYYLARHPDVPRDRSRDARFRSDNVERTPFDWVPTQDPAISAAILQNGQTGLFDFAAPPGTSGVALTQMQVLPAGSYRLAGSALKINAPANAMPFWTVTCLDGREVARVPMQGRGDTAIRFSGVFTVPQGCGSQTLALNLRATDDISGTAGQIGDAAIVPMSGEARQ